MSSRQLTFGKHVALWLGWGDQSLRSSEFTCVVCACLKLYVSRLWGCKNRPVPFQARHTRWLNLGWVLCLFPFTESFGLQSGFYCTSACVQSTVVLYASIFSVCLFVTRWYCVKITEPSVVKLMLHGRPMTLIFWCKRCYWNSSGVTANAGPITGVVEKNQQFWPVFHCVQDDVLAVPWATTLYIHFRGLLPVTEFCPVQSSLYVQVLRSLLLAALLHGTPAAGVSQLKLCGVLQGMKLRNFRRGRHLHWAGRPSRWASAHILVTDIEHCVVRRTAQYCHWCMICLR